MFIALTVLAAVSAAASAALLSGPSSADDEETVVEDGIVYTLKTTGSGNTATAGWDGTAEEVTIKASVVKDGVTYNVTGLQNNFSGSSVIKKVTFRENEKLKVLPDSLFSECGELKEVYLEGKISILPESIFDDCVSLTTVHLPSKLVKIGGSAFYDCKSLVSVDLKNVEEIDEYAFYWCTSLESVDLKNVKTIGESAFYLCKSLESTDLENVKEIGNQAFVNCNKLKKALIGPSLESCGVEVFGGCALLEEVDLGDGLTAIPEKMFSGCSVLRSVDLKNVETIGEGAFEICYGLERLDLPSVREIGYGAFQFCRQLVSVTLGDRIETIGGVAFGETSIRDIFIPASVTSIGFKHNKYNWDSTTFPQTLENLTVDGSNTKYTSVDNILFDKDMKTILFCSAKKSGELTVRANVGDRAFAYSDLSKVTFDDSVQSIGAEAFYCSKTLREVVFRGPITIGNNAFADCEDLAAVTLPDSVELGRQVFPDSMKYISFPENFKFKKSNPKTDELWSGLNLYDSDRETLIPGNNINDIKGCRFVWDGTDAEKLYKMTDDLVLVIAYVGTEASYLAAQKGEVYAPFTPELEHAEFGGWFTDPGFTAGYDGSVPLTSDLVLYAPLIWDEHTVRYIVDGEVVSEEKYSYGEVLSVLPIPERPGYTFADWITDASVTDGKFTVGRDIEFSIEGVPIEYAYTFMDGDAEFCSITFTVEDIADKVLPDVPAKDGYLVEWDTDAFSPENRTVHAVYIHMVPASGDMDITVELSVDTFLMPSEKKDSVTVLLKNGISVKILDASPLSGTRVNVRACAVDNVTGIDGTAYELSVSAEGGVCTGTMQVTLPYVREDGREPAVYRYDDGVKEAMRIVSSDDTSVTFETDRNSTFVMTSEHGSGQSPSGDGTLIYIAIGIAVALAAIGAAIFVLKRRA